MEGHRLSLREPMGDPGVQVPKLISSIQLFVYLFSKLFISYIHYLRLYTKIRRLN